MMEMDRPRERAMKYGMSYLHTNELIAILLRSGIPGKSAVELADDVLKLRETLGKLSTVTLEELMNIKGIKKAKALEIMACFELSKRMAMIQIEKKTYIKNPQILIEWLNSQIGYLEQEHFFVIFLNHKNEILTHHDMFVGQTTSCSVSTNEVFTQALRVNACRIILVHNHPSGHVIPSKEDIRLTNEFIEVGKVCGIECLDHIIVGHNRYFSFKEKQMIAS